MSTLVPLICATISGLLTVEWRCVYAVAEEGSSAAWLLAPLEEARQLIRLLQVAGGHLSIKGLVADLNDEASVRFFGWIIEGHAAGECLGRVADDLSATLSVSGGGFSDNL